jgi:salicylate 5-hydroxylase small subunit
MMETKANLQTYLELTQLYADYAAAVDAKEWDKWVDFFTENCEYKIQPRDN